MKLTNLRSMSVTRRLFVLTTVALIPALAILLYNLVTFHQAREQEVHQLALRSGHMISLELERIVSGAEGVLRTIARAPVVRGFDGAPCSSYFADVNEQLPQFSAIAAVDAGGLLRCRTQMPGTPVTLTDRSYFQEVMATGEFVIGEYTLSAVSGKATLPLAAPITNQDGAVVGVIVAGLDLGWLGERLRDRSFLPGSAVTIADRNGVILAREPLPERFVGTRIPEEFQPLVRGDKQGTMEVTSQDGTRRVIGYFPATIEPVGLYISAGISQEEALRPVFRATYQGLAIALLGAIIAYLAAWLIGSRLFREPVQKMLDTVQGWREGNQSLRTGMSRDQGELEELGFAVDLFLNELQTGQAARAKAEEHRDLLVRELDHRVKNMLATVQAVAIQTFKDQSNRQSLKSFAERLAAKAKVHDMLTAENWSRAGMAETIRTSIHPFDDEAQPRFSISGPPVQIRAKAALAISMAVHELCTNAVKYGALRSGDGRISIDWGLAGDAGDERFRFAWIERDGPPVKSPDNAGFGSRMIKQALAAELTATVDLNFTPTGVECIVDAAASTVLAEDGYAANEDASDEGPRRRFA